MSGQPGLGVMINNLFGGNGMNTILARIGQKIEFVTLKDDVLLFTFQAHYPPVKVWDDGQSCCETRHMSTDDDLAYFGGSTFLGLEVSQGPEVREGEYDSHHDIEFLTVRTSKGVFVMANHNEHNGYYGGFSLRSEEVES